MLCIELGADVALKDQVNQRGAVQASYGEDNMGANSARHGQELEPKCLLLEGIGGQERNEFGKVGYSKAEGRST